MPTEYTNKLLSVAPMMAWTDRHCRTLHRLFTPSALLFTEMVTTGALLHGQLWNQLDHSPQEYPLALQLGGNDPAALAECATAAQEMGYNEVNLNVGCPSDRVQKGTFGACLMRSPALVGECVAAMVDAVDIKVSVKCRLGVDDYDTDELLDHFIENCTDAGVERFYIHARKAILGGLSPAQNRSIPPLQPQRVYGLKMRKPLLDISVNGGVDSSTVALEHLQYSDGVMIGRAAYNHPILLAQLEQQMFDPHWQVDLFDVLAKYRIYIEQQLAEGKRLHSLTRHVLNVGHARPGARRFRRMLSDQKQLKRNDVSVFDDAIDQLYEAAA